MDGVAAFETVATDGNMAGTPIGAGCGGEAGRGEGDSGGSDSGEDCGKSVGSVGGWRLDGSAVERWGRFSQAVTDKQTSAKHRISCAVPRRTLSYHIHQRKAITRASGANTLIL
jgi:hypothetical protein